MSDFEKRDRYSRFKVDFSAIHPLKRLMRILSFCLGKRMSFFVFGLPVSETDGRAFADGPVAVLRRGIGAGVGANLTAGGRYVVELTSGAGPYIESRFLKKQRCFPRMTTGPDTVVSLVGNGDRNYYRWLMETLPRLRYLEETGSEFRHLFACQKEPFHRESLHMLVGADVKIVDSARVHYIQAGRKLLVPRLVDESEPWVIPWLRAKILPKRGAPPAPKLHPRRLYLSRQKATGRRITNEVKLGELLGRFGFVSVTPEDLCWQEQVGLFAEAEAVAGPHGAGLANLIFCPPGTRVLEFIAADYPFTFYPQICARLELEHHTLLSAPTDADRVHTSDLVAPLEKMREVLENTFA